MVRTPRFQHLRGAVFAAVVAALILVLPSVSRPRRRRSKARSRARRRASRARPSWARRIRSSRPGSTWPRTATSSRSSISPASPTPIRRRREARERRRVPDAPDRAPSDLAGRLQRHRARRVAERHRRLRPRRSGTGATCARATPGSASAQRVGVNQLRAWSPTRYGTLDVTGGGVRHRPALLRHLRPGRAGARQGRSIRSPASTSSASSRSAPRSRPVA